MSLRDASHCLTELAAGRTPERLFVLTGALALDELRARTEFSRDLIDAAEGLAILARGGKLELNDEGRERAAFLASIVQAADHLVAKPGPGAASGLQPPLVVLTRFVERLLNDAGIDFFAMHRDAFRGVDSQADLIPFYA
jgi:hypothetical protein